MDFQTTVSIRWNIPENCLIAYIIPRMCAVSDKYSSILMEASLIRTGRTFFAFSGYYQIYSSIMYYTVCAPNIKT